MTRNSICAPRLCFMFQSLKWGLVRITWYLGSQMNLTFFFLTFFYLRRRDLHFERLCQLTWAPTGFSLLQTDFGPFFSLLEPSVAATHGLWVYWGTLVLVCNCLVSLPHSKYYRSPIVSYITPPLRSRDGTLITKAIQASRQVFSPWHFFSGSALLLLPCPLQPLMSELPGSWEAQVFQDFFRSALSNRTFYCDENVLHLF